VFILLVMVWKQFHIQNTITFYVIQDRKMFDKFIQNECYSGSLKLSDNFSKQRTNNVSSKLIN